MKKLISLFYVCVIFIALSLNAYASDYSTKSPAVVKPTLYVQSGGIPAFSSDYYNSIYNDGHPQHRYHYRPTYTPINQSPYYNQNIPQSAIKQQYEYNGGSIPPFGTKPTYTPINKLPYYNQNIPKSAIKNEKCPNNNPYGVYPWNVKYTYTPANQIKYTPASQIKK